MMRAALMAMAVAALVDAQGLMDNGTDDSPMWNGTDDAPMYNGTDDTPMWNDSAPVVTPSDGLLPPVGAIETWCSSNSDCWIYGDGLAQCEAGQCQCELEGFSNPIINGEEIPICTKTNSSTVHDLLYSTEFVGGDFARYNDAAKKFIEETMRSILDAPFTVYMARSGSIVTTGGAKVSDESLLKSSADIEDEFKAAASKNPDMESILNTEAGVRTTATPAVVNSCEISNAEVAQVIDGRCIALACYDKYNVVTTATRSHCDREDRELDDGEIVGIVVACLIGCCALAFFVYWCFIRAKPEQKQLEEVHVEKAIANEPVDEPVKEEVKEVEPEVTREIVIPEPEPEPEPVVVPEPEPVVVAAPAVAAAVVPTGPSDEDKDAAARKIQGAARRYINRIVFLRILNAWKEQEAIRKEVLANGKTGSIGCVLSKDGSTVVSKVVANSGAEEAGLQPGDLIVAVQTKGRGGNAVYTPVHNKNTFMEGIGPAKGVFEGTEIKIIAFRDEAAKEAWASKKPAEVPDFGDKAEIVAWIDAARSIEPREERTVTVKPETEKTAATRVKNLNKIKEQKGIEAMDVDLVCAFMSDPVKCKEFTGQVYQDADSDKSGALEEKEIRGVFDIMATHTGCPPITDETAKTLFYAMDVSGDGQISFEEFYPLFRSHQLLMIHHLLYSDDDEE